MYVIVLRYADKNKIGCMAQSNIRNKKMIINEKRHNPLYYNDISITSFNFLNIPCVVVLHKCHKLFCSNPHETLGDILINMFGAFP